MKEGGDVRQTIRHTDAGELSFRCSATSDDATPVNGTWYRLETDPDTGYTYRQNLYNRSEKLSISGPPDNTLTIRLAGNDSEGWAVGNIITVI